METDRGMCSYKPGTHTLRWRDTEEKQRQQLGGNRVAEKGDTEREGAHTHARMHARTHTGTHTQAGLRSWEERQVRGSLK